MLLMAGCAKKLVPADEGFLSFGLTSTYVDSRIYEKYKTFTLFFDASRQYENTDNSELRLLKSRFSDFGHSIGKENLAQWVGWLKKDGTPVLSAEGGKHFTYLFNLNANDGPFLVFLKHPPNSFAIDEKPDDILVLALSGIPPQRIIYIMNRLEKMIVNAEMVSPANVKWEGVKQLILSKFQDDDSLLIKLASLMLEHVHP